jgi:phage FluMu protein Com
MEGHVDQNCEKCGKEYARSVFVAPDMLMEQEWTCESCGHLNKKTDLKEPSTEIHDSVEAKKILGSDTPK